MSAHAQSDYSVLLGQKVFRFLRGGAPQEISGLEPPPDPQQSTAVLYRHIFGISEKSTLPSNQALIALGQAMKECSYTSTESGVPAGYTYLAQFIFHDISALALPTRPSDPRGNVSPALDLTSVLPGMKPSDTPQLCGPDGLLMIGNTTELALPEDLPRVRSQFDPNCQRPIIGDQRNDDFLPLSQCHLLLLKFYNACACHLGYDGTSKDDAWWKRLRSLWAEHFQAIVLQDYLPRIIDCETYDDVMCNGRRLVRPSRMPMDDPWLPVEFAVAVGRFGHSMIRDSYDHWNRSLDNSLVAVSDFMRFSYANSNNRLQEGLNVNWVSNWLAMFDFTTTGRLGSSATCMKSSAIDTHLAPTLYRLPECLLMESCFRVSVPSGNLNLATLTLQRGLEMQLVTAQQAISSASQILGRALSELDCDQLYPKEDCFVTLLADYPELMTATPLWYYVLREAEIIGHGQKLGPLGGRIVMETIHAAIEAANPAVVKLGWKPKLPSECPDCFSMPDLILFSANPDPLGSV